MIRHRHTALALAALTLFAFGCAPKQDAQAPAGGADTAVTPAAPAAVASASADLSATQGNTAAGSVTFTEMPDGTVRVVADLTGLTPGQQHAMHVHENGDCSAPDASSAGSHYNPEKHDHALPPTEPRHAGDLGNVTADAEGKAHYEITVSNITIRGTKNPIDGKAVIVHANPDDGGQPVGNAGGRVACGVIVGR